MPFDALHFDIPKRPSGDEIMFAGTFAEIASIFDVKRECDWRSDVMRLRSHVANKLKDIGDANRAIAGLKHLPTETSLDRSCVDLAATAAYTKRSTAFSSLNCLRAKLRRAEKKWAIAQIAGEA